jgi:hypothetical protein
VTVITTGEPIDADTLRIRHEFLTRPDLRVSADEAAALLGVPLRHALVILESLVVERFLARTADGQYVRAFAAGAERDPPQTAPSSAQPRALSSTVMGL